LAITHGPYLQAVTESSAMVVWFTNKNCLSRVEYAAADAPFDNNEVKIASASHHGLVDAIVEGPYRVRTWDPLKEEFSFCVVNDIHENATIRSWSTRPTWWFISVCRAADWRRPSGRPTDRSWTRLH